MSYGLADVDGGKSRQTAFASDSTSSNSPTNIKSKNEIANEYNPALRTPTGVHPLLVDELLPADNYLNGVYWADLSSGGQSG